MMLQHWRLIFDVYLDLINTPIVHYLWCSVQKSLRAFQVITITGIQYLLEAFVQRMTNL